MTLLSALDGINQHNYQNGSAKLTCSKCGMDVPLMDSYSNHGKHAICRFCAQEEAERLNISKQRYLTTFVWGY